MKHLFQTQQRRATPWSHRDFRMILPARVIDFAATSMAMVTLLLRTHDAGIGPWAVAVLLGCFALPTIATMGLVGRWADTRDSRALLAVGLGIEAVAAAGLALTDSFVATCALVVTLALGQAIAAPVWSALLPRVVGEDLLGPAIAWLQGTGALAAPIGAAAAGVIYQAFGGATAFWAVSASTLVVLLAALAVRTRRHITAEQATDAPATTPRLLDGLGVLRADTVTWPLFVSLVVTVVLVEGINAAEVFLARDAVGATPAQYGLVEVASSIGGVLGAAIAAKLASDAQRVRAVLAGFALGCLGIAAAGTVGAFWAYFAVMALLTAAIGVGNAAMGALVMGRTPDADRGKVQAVLNGLLRLGTIAALVVGGTATTLLGPRGTFIAAGLAGTVALALTAVRLRGRTPTDSARETTRPSTVDA